uniref:SET domain-containing protein n=1 Tax=Panagrellus redivivus TaxID=6233 RepID=A0A7E4VA87_PANRE
MSRPSNRKIKAKQNGTCGGRRRQQLARQANRSYNLRPKNEDHLRVGLSAIAGNGLFARKDFKKGEHLINYEGEYITSEEADRREHKRKGKYVKSTYMFRVNKDLIIDATRKGNDAKFVNHMCEPNVEARTCFRTKTTRYYALTDIAEGDELGVDYNLNYDPNADNSDKTERCKCRPNCPRMF